MRIDRPVSIALIMFVLLAIALALLLPWQCARGQSTGTAGEFSLTFQYSAGVDRAMQRQYGTDWLNSFARAKLREAWQNHKSATLEAFKANAAEIFSDDIDATLLTNAERKTINTILDNVAARKTEKARIADSIARVTEKLGAIALPGVGKSLSTRLLFLADVGDSGSGGNSPHAGHSQFTSGEVWTGIAILAAVVAIAGLALYGAYKLIRGK